MGHVEGKRVEPKDKKGQGKSRAPLIAAGVVVAALAAGYVGLCAYAGGSAFWPNTTIGGMDVSGQSREQAVNTLEQTVAQRLSGLTARFVCEGKSYEVPGGEFTTYTEDAVSSATQGQNVNFFLRGVRYLTSLAAGQTYDLSVGLTSTPEAVEQAIRECADAEAQTTWTFTDNQLVFHKGVTGRTIDTQALTTALEEQVSRMLADGSTSADPVEAQVTTAPPAEPDFDAIQSEICVPAADAYLDQDSYEIVPSVTGVDFDVENARQLLNDAAEGSDVSVPVTLTEPKVTTATLEANLFKDVLGTGSTKCAGPSARWYNIDLAASRINGVILMPGDVFSYNDHCGPYTLASGYQKAGTYQNGQSIDATAGGICQLSSTLYWVTLKANLETVERKQHAFNGGYMPVVGTDATVWSDVIDFKFKNDTDYPIKIEAYQDKNHNLHVTIYGTDTTGIHGEPYSVAISTVPYKNLYKPDDSIPVGSEPQRDPNYSRYNGITVDVYQKLVDANGKTVETTFLYRNTYKSSDAVYYYNPADAARLGINTETQLRTETPVTTTPSPSPSASPSATPSASPSAIPSPSATPSVTPSATPTPAATPSATPTPADTPAATPSAEPTPTPVTTAPPVFTPASSPTAGPGMEPEA
ncbi:VanW family protein [uncultured Flavonifractor sp.]|uniref:VanW family protein n=1 Tax=uncultured Flavonifractor sp. TaxID=1193534 RepID=UPI00260E7BD1|nr:VanW family protein [uncultured Flavonifractor sp.]